LGAVVTLMNEYVCSAVVTAYLPANRSIPRGSVVPAHASALVTTATLDAMTAHRWIRLLAIIHYFSGRRDYQATRSMHKSSRRGSGSWERPPVSTRRAPSAALALPSRVTSPSVDRTTSLRSREYEKREGPMLPPLVERSCTRSQPKRRRTSVNISGVLGS
jgi:hypothetical protein